MAEQTESVSRFEPLSALWRVLAAPQTLLILMGLLALALVAGTLIPQMPVAFAGDPQAWLAMQTGVWGQASGVLYTLGVFDVYSSLWFRALLALLGLCLFVRTVDSAELAWRVTRRERWTRARLAAWGTHPPRFQLLLPLSLDETVERLGALLSRRGYWSSTVPDLVVSSFVAVRRGLVFWTRPLAYGSLLFALVCMAIAGAWGWQGEAWQPREGEVQAVGHGAPYSVRLDEFSIESGDGQQPAEYAGRVSWLEGEAVLAQGEVGAGRTSNRAGITLRQVGYVPIVRMRGWDSKGRPLMLETEGDVLSMTGEAEIRFASPEDQPLVLVPNEDLFLLLSFEPSCDGDGPALQVGRIREGGDDREALGTLHDSGSMSVDDLRFEVDLAFIPILRLDYYPALGLALIFLVLFIVALLANWLAPPRLLWIAAAQEHEHGSLVRLLALPGAGAQRWLSRLAKRFQEGLHDDA
jgi:hypothetical protein